MRVKKEKCVNKDKAIYDKKVFYSELPSRSFVSNYKQIMKGNIEYLLGCDSKTYFKTLFQNEDFADYLDRLQVMGLKDIGELQVELEVDNYTIIYLTFSVFNNLTRYNEPKFKVKDGEVVLKHFDLYNFVDRTETYIMFGDIMLQFDVKVRLDVNKLKTDKVLVINSIVSELEFIGDLEGLSGKEFCGFIREQLDKNSRGELVFGNTTPVFENVTFDILEDFFVSDYTTCIFKSCVLNIYGGNLTNANYRYYTRYGNKVKLI